MGVKACYCLGFDRLNRLFSLMVEALRNDFGSDRLKRLAVLGELVYKA